MNTNIGNLHIYGKIETIAGNYLAFYDNIYEVLRNSQHLHVKAEEALNVIKIINAAYESSRTRKLVNL